VKTVDRNAIEYTLAGVEFQRFTVPSLRRTELHSVETDYNAVLRPRETDYQSVLQQKAMRRSMSCHVIDSLPGPARSVRPGPSPARTTCSLMARSGSIPGNTVALTVVTGPPRPFAAEATTHPPSRTLAPAPSADEPSTTDERGLETTEDTEHTEKRRRGKEKAKEEKARQRSSSDLLFLCLSVFFPLFSSLFCVFRVFRGF
jgi:hypothetical protein